MPYAVWYTNNERGELPSWGRANMFIEAPDPRTGVIRQTWTGTQGCFHLPAMNDSGQFNLRVEAHAYALWRLNTTGASWTEWEIREEELRR